MFGERIRKPEQLLGESPDRLTLSERRAYAGRWIALELYTPETLPLRRIEAIAPSGLACAQALRERGLDPARYEYVPIVPGIPVPVAAR